MPTRDYSISDITEAPHKLLLKKAQDHLTFLMLTATALSSTLHYNTIFNGVKLVVESAAPTFGAMPFSLSDLSVLTGEGESLCKNCNSDFNCTIMESSQCFPVTFLQDSNCCNL